MINTGCEKIINDGGFDVSVTSSMICARNTDATNKGYPYIGDGGGPLVCNDGANNAIIVGIASQGAPCVYNNNADIQGGGLGTNEIYPTIYARVTAAKSWIESNMV